MSEEAMNGNEENDYNAGFDCGDETETPETASQENAGAEIQDGGNNAGQEQSEAETEEQTEVTGNGGKQENSAEEQENDWSDLIPSGEIPPEKNDENDLKDEKDKGASAASPAQEDVVSEILSDLPEDFQGINLKEFAEDYPEEMKAAAYIAQKIMEKYLGQGNGTEPKLPSDTDKTDPDAERMKQLEAYAAQKAQEDYDREVLKVHPDAVKIIRNDPRFKEWMKEQGKGIRNLFFHSNDPKDLCAILNTYKGAQKAVDPKRKSIYSGAGVGTGRKTGGSREDYDGGFDLGAKD